ncbi:uncharacterized protein Tco025E_02553 [Trypanosoma conorhini]|uniref:Uncharacterized protein n=1 Tax=Trypanosoma conorhini TaxID=83891 RepID=A0A3R7N2E3_9TRYP|nr:uncharacterized protein Tco025E_02553 [Trypanosoma conorhini]RNF24302.1 hypothetical protein Tco025E_02553 [Trypanosoma conorhini]
MARSARGRRKGWTDFPVRQYEEYDPLRPLLLGAGSREPAGRRTVHNSWRLLAYSFPTVFRRKVMGQAPAKFPDALKCQEETKLEEQRRCFCPRLGLQPQLTRTGMVGVTSVMSNCLHQGFHFQGRDGVAVTCCILRRVHYHAAVRKLEGNWHLLKLACAN